MTATTIKPPRRSSAIGRLMALDPNVIDRNLAQPRQEFDEEKQRDLEASVRANGVITPLGVIDLDNGRYQLVYGERRLRAALATKQHVVPCTILTQKPDWKGIRTTQLIENTHRADLTPLEFWQTVQILWLAEQTTALAAEDDLDGGPVLALDDTQSPTAQIADLTDRVLQASGCATLDAYLGSGKVRVPFGTVLEQLGFSSMTAAQRKKGLQVLDVSPDVQDLLAGVNVSARALRDLAKQDPDHQAALVSEAKQTAAQDGGDVGAALRAALDAPFDTGMRSTEALPALPDAAYDVDLGAEDDADAEDDQAARDAALFRPEKAFNPDDAIPGFVKGGNAPRLVVDQPPPGRGSTPPSRDGWDHDQFLMLLSGFETMTNILDDAGPTPLSERQAREAGVLWRELAERIPRFGIEQEA